MTTPQPARAGHPEIPPPTGDAVPVVAEQDRAAAERTGARDDADNATEAYADAERADIAKDEAEAARQRHG